MPQDQDDIKEADAMKQAPAPGPLDSESVKLLVKGDLLEIAPGRIGAGKIIVFDKRDGGLVIEEGDDESYYPDCYIFHSRPCRLAPTAPVEASGSADDAVRCARQVKAAQGYSEKTGELDRWIAEYPHDFAVLVSTFRSGLSALRPQPSGETREGYVNAFYEIAEMLGMGAQAASPAEVWTREMRPRLEALIRPAPVASGGQHSSGEGERERVTDAIQAFYLIDWNRTDAEELADAILSAKKAVCGIPPNGWECTRTPGHEGPCAAVPTPVQPEAPVAETAGEAVAWIDPTDLAQVDEGLATETVLFPREHASATIPLYASPVSAQDDDKLRIAAEALEDISTNNVRPSANESGLIGRLRERATEALAALKAEGK